MCAETKVPCRALQLFQASEKIVDLARELGSLPANASFADIGDAHSKLRAAVGVFDRLNRGI